MNFSHASGIELFADALMEGAAMELYLTPKPGLVDLADNGSHHDLSVALMERSLSFISVYLGEIVSSLAAGEPFSAQAAIGLRTERAMLASLGTNTHKGYLFLSGLFLVAHKKADSGCERGFRAAIADLATDFFGRKRLESTNGGRARTLYRAGGIVREATAGFPSLFEEAVPAYLDSYRRCGCRRTASYAMMGRLMQCVEDTTTLHRCGPVGLERIRRDGRRIEYIAAAGGDSVPFIKGINGEYIRKGLTMGGVADMMGLSFAYLQASGHMKPVSSYSPFYHASPGSADSNRSGIFATRESPRINERNTI